MMTHCRVCGRSHRTITGRARCIRGTAVWIHRAGPGTVRWALLAHCTGRLTVTLHRSRRDAEQRRQHIDRTGCGHLCTRHHEVLDAAGMNLEGTRS